MSELPSKPKLRRPLTREELAKLDACVRERIATNVRRARSRLHLTRAQLSRRCKLPAELIGAVEDGSGDDLALDTIVALANGLETGAEDLLRQPSRSTVRSPRVAPSQR